MKKPQNETIDQALKSVALRMALHCVRNTVIEDYHAEDKITDPEMMAFNKEVVNKIYTFLHLRFNPQYVAEMELLLNDPFFGLPAYWDEPKFDQGLVEQVDLLQAKSGG